MKNEDINKIIKESCEIEDTQVKNLKIEAEALEKEIDQNMKIIQKSSKTI